MAGTFKRYLTQNATANTLTVVGGYYVPANTKATVIGLQVANKNATFGITTTITLNNNTVNTYITSNTDVGVGSSAVFYGGEQKLVLEPNDSIMIFSSKPNSADVIMSVLEIT